MTLDWTRYPNFTEAEMCCKCGCGRADMDEGFMDRLQAMRTEAGIPFQVNSGYRCPDYNDRISTTGRNGPHPTGHAVDLGCSGGRAHEVQRLAHKHGMTGIGSKQHGPHEGRFLHLDDLKTPPRPNIWGYPLKGMPA